MSRFWQNGPRKKEAEELKMWMLLMYCWWISEELSVKIGLKVTLSVKIGIHNLILIQPNFNRFENLKRFILKYVWQRINFERIVLIFIYKFCARKLFQRFFFDFLFLCKSDAVLTKLVLNSFHSGLSHQKFHN